MPKESKPILCCGELQTSPIMHKRRVHQHWTRIRFDIHPAADFTLHRENTDHLFHCPKCDKASALALPIRNHIAQECEGYAQYRQTFPKIKIKPLLQSDEPADVDMDEPVPDNDVIKSEPDDEQEEAGKASGSAYGVQTQAPAGTLQTSLSIQSLAYPESLSGEIYSERTSEPRSPKPSNDAGPVSMEKSGFSPPLLRPASWSMSDTDAQGPFLPRPSSLTPLTARTESTQSSASSLRTMSDASCLLRLPIKTEFDYGFDTYPQSNLPPARIPEPREVNQQPPATTAVSAAHVFLEGLRRPLGYATPYLRALGIVTDADLDLVCTMPETWEELGDLLRRNGVTVIEWLMVKEAFKTRAKGMEGSGPTTA